MGRLAGEEEVQVGALERRGLAEAFPKMGDEVHDAAAAVVEEADGRQRFVDGETPEGREEVGGEEGSVCGVGVVGFGV